MANLLSICTIRTISLRLLPYSPCPRRPAPVIDKGWRRTQRSCRGDLLARIEGYAGRRAAGGMGTRLAPQAALLLREALLRGEFKRGDAPRITGISARTARRVLGVLVDEKLLASDTTKGAVRLGLPVHVVGFYFPQLFPESALD